jgi:hypothetical protein
MTTTTAPAWRYYRSQLAGNACAVCATCGEVYLYWETDDLEAHTEQHEMEKTK